MQDWVYLDSRVLGTVKSGPTFCTFLNYVPEVEAGPN